MKWLASWVLIAALTCSPLWADAGPDPNPDPNHVANIQKRVADSIRHHRIVVVETFDHRQLQGSVSEAQPDGFVLSNHGRSTTLTYAEVDKVTWSTHVPREVWALVGAAGIAAALYGLVRLLGGLNG